MNPTLLLYIFIVLYALNFALELALDVLNLKHVAKHKTIPPQFSDQISENSFHKSREYATTKLKFSIFSRCVSTIILFSFLQSGLLNHIHQLLSSYTRGLTLSVAFILITGLFFTLTSLPLRLYSTFVIEQKFGFNKMTWQLFVQDMLKSSLLSLLIGVPILYMIFAFMSYTEKSWWLWTWGFIVALQFLLMILYPTFIAPLFNRFIPLAQGSLRSEIEALARKINFSLADIFTIDGSKRSGHSNAYFAGLGRFRRIVLFDTLISQLSEKELLAVLAHEMGHNIKHHITKGIILGSLMSLIGLYILAQLKSWPEFYLTFNVPQSDHTALFIFAVVSDVFTFFLTPVFNSISRHHEYEADRFAAESTTDPDSMQTALIKLSKENLSNLYPHPWYSFFHYSHPTTSERISALQRIAA